MGYYTEHTLTARKVRDKEQYEAILQELKDRDLLNYALCKGNYNNENHEVCFPSYDAVKWYDHPEDMVAIAEKFPNVYFMLEGSGEEFGDFWREYYHDMDVEHCRGDIVFEEPKKVQWKDLITF